VLENEVDELQAGKEKLLKEVSQLRADLQAAQEATREASNKLTEQDLVHKSALRLLTSQMEEIKFEVQRQKNENAFLLKQNDSLKHENSTHIHLLQQEKMQLETELTETRDRH
jgi:hypothetical protein